MALLNPVKKLINVGKFEGRVASAVRRRYIQASSKQQAQACERAKETVKQGVNEAKEVNKKANSKAQSAWDSAKETAQKAKDNMFGKGNESKEVIKQNAEKIKQSMNKKD